PSGVLVEVAGGVAGLPCAEEGPGAVGVVALTYPVAMAVRGNALSIETVQGSSVDGGEFVVARGVVADAAVENLAVPYVARVFYADPNGDSGLGASAKDLASLFFPVGLPHVAAEVVDVNAVVVFYEGETDSVRGVVLDPSAVGDEGD